jgi:FkbM family methyltransferase
VPQLMSHSVYRRIKRGLNIFRKGLSDAHGLACKWEVCRGLAEHVRAQLGWPGHTKEMTIHVDGLEMVVDPNRAEIVPFWEIWYEHQYELLPEFCAAENSYVVDVGGNVGFYAARQAARAYAGRVVVFEPSLSAFSRLRRNLAKNRLVNAVAVNVAVGASSGMVHFAERSRSINSRMVEQASSDTVDVPCVTLDAELARLGINRVSILKIDTEGAERSVLAGATEIVPQTERVVVELHGNHVQERRMVDHILQPAGLQPVAQQGTVVYYSRLLKKPSTSRSS